MPTNKKIAMIKKIKEQIPGISTGFDTFARPWTEAEQQNAVKFENDIMKMNKDE